MEGYGRVAGVFKNDKSATMRILLVGTPYDVHMGTFSSYLAEAMPMVKLDLFSVVERNEDKAIPSAIDNIYFKKCHFPRFVYKVPGIQNIVSAIDFKISFSRQINEHYSFVNVHYISIENAFCYRVYRRVSDKLLLTPYGSDIMRAPGYVLKMLRGLFNSADYVCDSVSQLSLVVKNIYNIPDTKLVNLTFGSSVIDELDRSSMTKSEAKCILGINGLIAITVGYNASRNQNHIHVIEQIGRIPDSIKSSVVILLPLTYPSNKDYISLLKSKLKDQNLEYIVFDRFLSMQEMIIIRLASDIFINAQITDASSASVKEYLLADNVLLNASWLDYPLLRNNGVPFVVFNAYEELCDLICQILESKDEYKLQKTSRDFLLQEGWKKRIKEWAEFFANKQ